MPPGWRRLSPAEKAEVRRLYQAALRGGPNSSAVRALYERLRGKGRQEILEILEELGRDYAVQRVEQMRESAREAGRRARRAATETLVHRAVAEGKLPQGGDLRTLAARWLRQRVEGPLESYRVSPIRGQRSSLVTPEGDVWLSRNLHRVNTRGVIDGLRRAIQDAARHGETASSLAQRLRDEVGHRVRIADNGPPSVRIPQLVRDIEREAAAMLRATGDPRAAQRFASVRDDLRSWASQLKGTEKGMQAAGFDLVDKIQRAVARADVEAVQTAVKWWTWNREQEHQRLIARTELTRSYSHAYVEASRQVPWVVAWEWNCDDDPCEECQALDGRVMERGEVIYPPLHPNCECWLTEIVDSSVEPTEDEWERMMADAA